MSKIFLKYEDVFDYEDGLLITPNHNYEFESNARIKHLSDFKGSNLDDFHGSIDYIETNNKKYLLYLVFRKVGIPETIKSTTYIFLKNKLYHFSNKDIWCDEIGNIINEYNDIWYYPFLFVKKENEEKAIRALKLNKCIK